MKLKKILILLLIVTMIDLQAFSQGMRAFNNHAADPVLQQQGNFHNLFKTGIEIGSNGVSLALSYGMWKENPALQYSLNTGLQWRFGRKFLGNFRDDASPHDNRSRNQMIFMFSPMLTANLGSKDYVYQELQPFNFGSANAVFSKYKYSATLGTTITVSPRGTYKNIATARNRSQQVSMLSFNLKNFNITGYDDYLSIFSSRLQLGDNWDRFFTSSISLRYRFNDQYTAHIYSDVYTGINRANAFLNPDIISYKILGKNKWKRKNYANQDPGQEYFNSAWLLGRLTYTGTRPVGNNAGAYQPGFDVYFGSDEPWTMFSQRIVHSMIHYDKENKLSLHYFMHRANVPGNLDKGGTNAGSAIRHLFGGIGMHYNISMP